jgi:BirA family biotin operon repressor/biotin-[acetyl-CoA-carboxylase] ligase
MLLHRYEQVDSTQRVARALAEQGAPHGTVVLAEEQTAGRGRLDRVWSSPPGENLTFTVVLRPRCPVAEAPLLTLGAAAGLALAFHLRVKWPNDVVTAEGRKVAGLLAEMDLAPGGAIRWVLLGVGLNVNQTAFPAHLPNASSLALEQGPQPREEVLERAVSAILAWSQHPDRLDTWRARSHTLGRRVRIGEVEGVARGLRADGALLVEGAPVTFGEIDGAG